MRCPIEVLAGTFLFHICCLISCSAPPAGEPEGLTSSAQIRWSMEFMGTGHQSPRAMAVDEGSILIGGKFNGSMEILPNQGSSSEKEDGFVAMLDKDGVLLWSAALKGAGDDSINAVSLDGSLAIVAGHASDAASLGNFGFPAAHTPLRGFAAALSRETGEVIWLSELSSMHAESADAIVSRGGPGMIVVGAMEPEGVQTPSFVSCLSRSDGSIQWTRELRAMGEESEAPAIVSASVDIDVARRISVAGVFSGPGIELFGSFPSAGNQSAFVAWLTEDGNPSGMLANVLRKEHEAHGEAHPHEALIDRVSFLGSSASEGTLVGAYQAEWRVPGVPSESPPVFKVVLSEGTERRISTLANLEHASFVSLAGAATRGTRGRFVVSMAGNAMLTGRAGRRTESVAVFEVAGGAGAGAPRPIASIHDEHFDLSAVSAGDEGTAMVFLCSKRSSLQGDGQPEGTTVLLNLDI